MAKNCSTPLGSTMKKDLVERQDLFSFKSTLPAGEIIFDGEIPFGDEIRTDAGRVDLISSASVDFIRAADFLPAKAGISFL